MRAVHLLLALVQAAVGLSKRIEIIVGDPRQAPNSTLALRFVPEVVTAAVGDDVVFIFNNTYTNHRVVQSSFDTPCGPPPLPPWLHFPHSRRGTRVDPRRRRRGRTWMPSLVAWFFGLDHPPLPPHHRHPHPPPPRHRIEDWASDDGEWDSPHPRLEDWDEWEPHPPHNRRGGGPPKGPPLFDSGWCPIADGHSPGNYSATWRVTTLEPLYFYCMQTQSANALGPHCIQGMVGGINVSPTNMSSYRDRAMRLNGLPDQGPYAHGPLGPPWTHHDDDDGTHTPGGKIAVAVTLGALFFFAFGLWLFCRRQDRKLKRWMRSYHPTRASGRSGTGTTSLPIASAYTGTAASAYTGAGSGSGGGWRLDVPSSFLAGGGGAADPNPASRPVARATGAQVEEEGLPRYEDRRGDVLLNPITSTSTSQPPEYAHPHPPSYPAPIYPPPPGHRPLDSSGSARPLLAPTPPSSPPQASTLRPPP